MDFLVLGPLEVRDSGRRVPLGGPKQRAVLAILLLHANRVVSRDRLIDGVWGDRPPRTAPHVVESYISQLRRVLRDSGHGAELVTHGHGYSLETDSTQIDLHRFEGLLAEGRRRLGAGDAAAAAEKLNEALGLFRGPPLDDLAFSPFACAEAERLEEVRLGALQDRVAAELQAGRGAELVAELQTLSEQHPFAEPFRAQLCSLFTAPVARPRRWRCTGRPIVSWPTNSAWSRATPCVNCSRRSSGRSNPRARGYPAQRAGLAHAAWLGPPTTARHADRGPPLACRCRCRRGGGGGGSCHVDGAHRSWRRRQATDQRQRGRGPESPEQLRRRRDSARCRSWPYCRRGRVTVGHELRRPHCAANRATKLDAQAGDRGRRRPERHRRRKTRRLGREFARRDAVPHRSRHGQGSSNDSGRGRPFCGRGRRRLAVGGERGRA